MSKITDLYFINHSHTDIGFTDYQEVVYRQHAEFTDAALDLIEETDDYPEEAKAKWVCEVTGMTEPYLRRSSPKRVERFLEWHRAGRIDVAGMQYNLTPLLNVEQMHRTLYPLRRLRETYGIETKVAMNCDVNGASWMFADLLPQVGIDFFTMAINTVRGRTPKPRPSAFWWEGPSGGRVLAWNGYHYLFGGLMNLGGDVEKAAEKLGQLATKLENDPDYPFDFIYGQATHPARVDNGPPDRRLPDFVRRWNEEGRTPRLAIVTLSQFREIVRRRAESLPTLRGDWLDWWSDGVASSAYETGMNRATHELLHAAEMLGTWLTGEGKASDLETCDGEWAERMTDAYHSATLYDEHTWGAYSSIAGPQTFFTKSQWNQKAHYAYSAAANTHDLLARAARCLAGEIGKWDGDVSFTEAEKPVPTYEELLVINTLPWERRVVVEEPVRKGGQAPNGMLEMFLPRHLGWGGIVDPPEGRRVEGRVPGFGYAFLPLTDAPAGDDLSGDGYTIENRYYRVSVDPMTGGLAEWYDKELEHDIAGEHRGWRLGQYVYEWIESEEGRRALFYDDFLHEEFGYGRTDTPFRHETASRVEVDAAVVKSHAASITVRIEAPGVRLARCTFILPTKARRLNVNWVLDKAHVTDIEAVFIAFPFNVPSPEFRGDLNGVPATAERDQLPGTVRDWYPVHRWADVSGSEFGVTVVPEEAPLMHFGGITTGKWAHKLEPEGSALMSWVMNNHWMVNFKASQGGETPFDYTLTTHAGPCDDAAAARFGLEVLTPPVVLRDYHRQGDAKGQFLRLEGNRQVLVTGKRADGGDGAVFRLQNVSDEPAKAVLRFETPRPRRAALVSPVEDEVASLEVVDGAVTCPLKPREVRSVWVAFGD